jgi:hypothetical protein
LPDTILDNHSLPSSQATLPEASASGAGLLFGDDSNPPIWLWLMVEPQEIAALEQALLEHLRSPLFPARVGERGCWTSR